MAKTISLIASRSFRFGERSYSPGERFDVSPIEAAALTYQKKATFAPKGDRTIKRRDLQPEPPPVASQPSGRRRRTRETSDDPKPKRTYRRRDLEAGQ